MYLHSIDLGTLRSMLDIFFKFPLRNQQAALHGDEEWLAVLLWWLFPLPFIIAEDGIRFSETFLRELALRAL